MPAGNLEERHPVDIGHGDDEYIRSPQQIMLLFNMVVKICNFWLKTYLTVMALVPSYVNKFAIFLKNQNLQTNRMD